MARTSAAKTYSTFVAGLMTEATPLNYPANTVLDTLNCVFEREGNIKRRLGVDYEASATLTSKTIAEATWQTKGVGVSKWTNVAGDGNLNYLVIQVDTLLYYVDMSGSSLSSGLKSFTTNLASFAAPAATDIGSDLVSVDSGKGFLYVTGKKIKPFYVSYSASGDSITNTEIGIQIRDFDGLDDGLAIDEEPTSLSTAHSYNLKNQGWISPGASIADPVTTYHSAVSKYPANNKQWWTAKNTSGDLDSTLLTKFFTGNTLAPRGHFVFDPFNKDYDSVSGLSGIASVTVTNRPQAVQFFAGRAFFGGPTQSDLSSHIFFSQIIEDETKIGKCYQEADPTSEDISDLIDTDGGVIVIPEMGNCLALKATGSSLLVFGDNGVWEITGSAGQGFSATDYAVSNITSVGLIGPRSVVDVEGVPMWWSAEGIYTIGRNDVTDRIEATSLTKNTIQKTYNDIDSVAKLYCQGAYDAAQGTVTWVYSDGATTNYRFKFNNVLVLDVNTGAIYLHKIGTLTSNSPYVAGIFSLPALTTVTQTENVIQASSGNTVIRQSDSEVVVADITNVSAGEIQTKFFTPVPVSTNSEWTYSLFNNNNYKDWISKDSTGVDYTSFFDTGYLVEGDVMNKKQSPYIYVYSKRTETGYISDGSGGFTIQNDSSCFMQARWQFADNSNSSRFGRTQQIYRRGHGTYNDTANGNLDFDDGFPVVVTRNKIRGGGQSLHLRFSSESGKDFNLFGWAVVYSTTTQP